MSVDVYLYVQRDDVPTAETCLACAVEYSEDCEHEELVFTQNTTHNLGTMADAAGVYHAIWRPDELMTNARAADITPLLRAGLDKLKSQPEVYKKFNPSNGWGSYDSFVPWVEAYLAACEMYPTARVHVSR